MKKTNLEILQKKSSDAVGIIRATIEKLKSANAEIDGEHQKNEACIEHLKNTNASLDELKTTNEKVIANFENLLGVN